MFTEWTRSRDGHSLYRRLLQLLSATQLPEQLVLILSALVAYQQRLPDLFGGYPDELLQSCYLAGLDALLHQRVKNARAVGERMALATIRVLESMEHRLPGLLEILFMVIHRRPPLMHQMDGFSDHYMALRLRGLDHDDTMRISSPVLGLNEGCNVPDGQILYVVPVIRYPKHHTN